MRDFFRLVIIYIKPHKTHALLNIFFSLVSVFFSLFSLGLLIPFLGILFGNQELVTQKPELSFSTNDLLDYFYFYMSKIIIAEGKIQALLYVIMFIMTMIFLKNFFIYFAKYYLSSLRNMITRDIRGKIYKRVLHLHLAYLTDEQKGNIMSRMTTDVQEFELSAISTLEMIFRDPVHIIIFLASLFFISPSLTILILIFFPLSGFLVSKIGKSLRRSSTEYRQRMGTLMSIIEETIGGLRIIKAFVAESKMLDRFYGENYKYTKIANRIYRKEYLASPLSEFFSVLTLLIVMYYGATMVLGNETAMQPEVFIGYITIFSQIIAPAKGIATAYYRIQKGMASIDRINEVISTEIKIKEDANPLNISKFTSSIEFENVSFKYEDQYVLKNIDLNVNKGKTIALVGQSGSGKSTLVDLLPRFYDINEGDIKIDGRSIKKLKIKDLRSLMGNVNQEPILFNDTIFNNIAFGVENTTKEQVVAAAKVANAHNFIMETTEGYQTNIGDRGSKLSGGQRQRLSIARAVLKNPPILILDEATSALDTESERLVQDALINLMKNRTSIVIAHRLSTIKHADEICVLHEGKIVERGKHDDLIKNNGAYKRLHDLQMF
ncbi:MAG: antibiotic ABC transporter ATP-binding protein [Bacteroidetes bacterium 4572_117]|nr:MAG: antibiotic ABC transporter ATP-binding protein [Bacteroidetes bacterium 4572_117]